MKHQEIIFRKALQLREAGKLQDALDLVLDNQSLYPDDPQFHSLIGQILVQQGEHSNAITSLSKALSIDENLLDARFTLGVAYHFSTRYQLAIEALSYVIEKAPALPQPYYYRGLAFKSCGNDPEAKKDFERALCLDPEYAEAMGYLAEILFRNYHFDAAEQLLLQALKLKPERNEIKNNLARLYQLAGRNDEAVALFQELIQLDPQNRHALNNLLYSLCYMDTFSPSEIATEHRERCAVLFPADTISPTHNKPDTTGKIRIGYISNDFFLHSVSFFIEPILIHHNRQQFQIFCYSNRSGADDTTDRIRSLELVWRDISQSSDHEAAEMIRKDKIDILIDLSGHTAENRLDVCALKPAPVMASWIGYPHSTGMRQFDYYISDPVCAPPGLTDHLYVEKVWRLPRVFSCYLPPMEFPPVAIDPPCNQNGYITFGSFNNLAKVSDTTVRLWSNALKQVTGSKLFLKSASLGGTAARNLIIDKFASQGICEDRLILKVHAPTPFDHLKMYADIDIALDTWPYNGTTTTCEALWMGVPLITLAGDYHLARVSATFLSALDCQELIAHTEDEFAVIAANLAADRPRLEQYRSNLRTRMANSPLMDAAGVTREVEQAFTLMVSHADKESSYEKK